MSGAVPSDYSVLNYTRRAQGYVLFDDIYIF